MGIFGNFVMALILGGLGALVGHFLYGSMLVGFFCGFVGSLAGSGIDKWLSKAKKVKPR